MTTTAATIAAIDHNTLVLQNELLELIKECRAVHVSGIDESTDHQDAVHLIDDGEIVKPLVDIE